MNFLIGFLTEFFSVYIQEAIQPIGTAMTTTTAIITTIIIITPTNTTKISPTRTTTIMTTEHLQSQIVSWAGLLALQ